MISSKELLLYLRKEARQPVSVDDLALVFSLVEGNEIQELKKLLKNLVKKGEVFKTEDKKYVLPEKFNLVVGKLQSHSGGYGFVLPEYPGMADIYVNETYMNGAMHGDRVMVKLVPRSEGRRREGEIVNILERANKRVVGTFKKTHRRAFVEPDESRLGWDIMVPRGEFKGARPGDKVLVEITKWPERLRGPYGRVIEVLGPSGAPGVDILALCKKYRLPEEFPPQVTAEVARLDEISAKDLEGRRDLRGLTMVTIDGEDAKDLDDAVSLEVLSKERYRLGVHIADVGYYVREGTALDKEALERGTSVYLVDRVIPMLPPRLSNEICSLNPGVDRLAMSVIMDIDGRGQVLHYEIFPSIIKINARMTYEAVRKILVDEDPLEIERYRSLVNMFRHMKELCLILRKKRFQRGAIDFNLPELKVELDDKGKPVKLIKQRHTIAEKIIEEFMIVTNETVAQHFYYLDIPFVYRVHEEPDVKKIIALNEFLSNFNYRVKGTASKVHPRAMQEVLESVKGKPEERLINTVVLRSMKQAFYGPVNLGHFGLASECYTHFTSPIRRYPDLTIHRIIREVITGGGLSERRKEELYELLPLVAERSSERERTAIEAERESVEMKSVEYMKRKIGEVFPGVISGITNFGMFVELENLVEGLVHLSSINDDYYFYEEESYTLVGEHTRKRFRIGDRVKVKVIRVDVGERRVDFELA